jgi:sodium transport system permease protein
MNWSNVKLICQREVKDQLRDRRTLFMIAVLPLLLYPLLGMSFFQIAQFMREQASQAVIVGAEQLEGLPALVEQADGEKRIAASLFTDASRAKQIKLHERPAPKTGDAAATDELRRLVQEGEFDVVIFFPPDFRQRLNEFSQSLEQHQEGEAPAGAPQVPSPDLFYSAAKEKSQLAYARVYELINRWRDAIGQQNLAASQLPVSAARPFDVSSIDVAEEGHRKAAVWSKVLPFVLLLWALTGAFYPAVDLCAGEKERGTLETLLSSPAERIEIVWGKLLTIMLFSIATALLNLASMGLTGSLILSQLPNLGPPPPQAILWLVLALVPVAALFGALCLALAAFARSTKEGQYYLMPLVLITMPLTILPMSPGVELNVGNSLIPITGIVLLLRTLLEGNFTEALPYIPLVAAVTLGCCWWAIRWATDQFNKESVLFRESERWDLSLWLKHLRRDRDDTPTAGEALFCGVLILLISFFMNFSLPKKVAVDLASLAVVTQLVVVLTPTLLMTVMLTRSPRKTLLLHWPRPSAPVMTVLLAVALHPLARLLQVAVERIYPINADIVKQLAGLTEGASLPALLIAVAVIPPICEELAFRGFVLSGLRHLGHKWWAIVISAIFFAVTHSIFQQSLVACLFGIVLGYIAVQTGSLLPSVLFHMTHNALALLAGKLNADAVAERPYLGWLVDPTTDAMYRWPVIAAGFVMAAAIFWWLHKLPHTKTKEERLQDAWEHLDSHHAPPLTAAATASSPSVSGAS